MAGIPWTAPEDQRIRDGVERAETNDTIAADLPGRSSAAVRYRRHTIDLPTDQTIQKVRQYSRHVAGGPDHAVFAADTNADEPIDDLLERAIHQTSRACDRSATRPYALTRIVTQQPIGICFPSDQHISMTGATRVDRLFEDAELIRDTPGMYCILGGDGCDNHLKHRRALVTSGSPPSEEWRLYNHYLATLGYRTLGIVSGNHDNWSVTFAGIDMVAHLAKNEKIHYAPDEIVMTIQLVNDIHAPDESSTGQEYVVKMRHKYRYSSSLNLLHTVKRMYDMGEDPFDIGVVCHHHEAAMETFNRHGLTRYAFRPGSYQVTTSYGREEGYNRSFPTCPTVVLWPGERRIEPFEDIRKAAAYLGAVRDQG